MLDIFSMDHKKHVEKKRVPQHEGRGLMDKYDLLPRDAISQKEHDGKIVLGPLPMSPAGALIMPRETE